MSRGERVIDAGAWHLTATAAWKVTECLGNDHQELEKAKDAHTWQAHRSAARHIPWSRSPRRAWTDIRKLTGAQSENTRRYPGVHQQIAQVNMTK